MSNNHKLQWLLDCLADLKDDEKKIQLELRATTDVLVVKTLGRRLDTIFNKIESLENEIQQQNNNLIQRKFDRLFDILQSDEAPWEKIRQAYQDTLSHWPTGVKQNVGDVRSIIAELDKIAQGSCDYSALDEFIANLFHAISDVVLINNLTQWGKEYCQNMDWLSLYTKVQESKTKRLEKAQPAILIAITRNDEASTQAQDGEIYYQIESWLIEDIEIYRAKQTGFQSLFNAGYPDAEPCILEKLQEKITSLLDQFLKKQREHCRNCENYPEIHVFLPPELMDLAVDAWVPGNSPRPKCLGHDYLVFIRCANRYDGNYKKYPTWKKLWHRHQDSLQVAAHNMFVQGHDQDLGKLIRILDDAAKDNQQFVGLHVTDVPVNLENLVYELLESGLPLAIWSRSNLARSKHQTEVSKLLKDGCLEALPLRVKDKRAEIAYQPQENTKEKHVGHHLSLLWDDPNFYPPKSA